MSKRHDVIWLQPECCADPDTGPLWCEDKVWPDKPDWCAECNKAPEQPTKYLLATPQREAAPDLYEAAKAVIASGRLKSYPVLDERLRAALAKAEGKS